MPASRPFVLASLSSILALSSIVRAEEAAAAPPPPPDTTPAATPAPLDPTPAPAVATPAPADATPAPADATPAEAPLAPKAKPPPYSLPFQLRPVSAGTVIRSDTSFAFYDAAGKSPSGSTIASTLLASYKITPELSPLVRVGVVENSPPAGDSGTAFLNPVLGAIYGIKPTPETRLGLFLGVTLPIGSGGGNTPDKATATAVKAGPAARSMMDNSMFAVNYFAVFPGAGFAYVANGLTLQVEATLFQLARVRGDAVEKDSSKTNLTMGAHVGYFLISELSLGVELRHQRWLSTPAAVTANGAARDTTTFAVGPRLHFKLSDTAWFRPGISYSRALDEPMSTSDYNIVQLDLPFSF